MTTATLSHYSSAVDCTAQGIAESGFPDSMLSGGLLFGEDVNEKRGMEEWAVTYVLEGRPKVCGELQVEGTDGGENSDWSFKSRAWA
ncbi:hypothetical protein FF1_009092 [Malus domestica]